MTNNNNSFGGRGNSPQQGNSYPQQENRKAYLQPPNGQPYSQRPSATADNRHRVEWGSHAAPRGGSRRSAGLDQQPFNGSAGNTNAYSSIDSGRRLAARNQVTVDHNDARQDALAARTADRARRRQRLLTYTVLALVIALILTFALIWIFSRI